MASGPKRSHDDGQGGPEDWKRLHLWQVQPVRDVLVLAAVFGLLFLGYTLRIVTVPILLAIAMSYLFEPVVARLTRSFRWLSRSGVAVGVIVIVGLAVAVPATIGVGFATIQGTRLIQSLATNVQLLVGSVDQPNDPQLRARLPGQFWKNARDYIVEQEGLRRTLQQRRENPPDGAPPSNEGKAEPGPTDHGAPMVQEAPSPVFELVQTAVVWLRENRARVGQAALRNTGDAVTLAAQFFGSAVSVGFGVFLTVFFFYFFCTGYGRVLQFWHGLIPQRRRGRVFDLLDKMDRVIAGFIRGRLTISAVLVLHYSVGYWLIGVPAPLILGPIVGVLSILPYIAGLGIPVSMLLMALEPGTGWQAHWWWIVGSPLLVHGVAQVIDDYILTPSIQGKTTDMDTPSIVFASLAGGVLGGVYGLLLAIPAAACLKILLREVFWPRFRKWAEGKAKDFLPIEPG